jgi:hypothetical protein
MPDYGGISAMFKKNPAEKQFNLSEPYYHFPKYVREALHNSWAEHFFHSIFTKIDENRFAVLYSENYSRPNAAVNVIIGLLMLKELNGWTDEGLIAALYFDYRVQYALGISDFDKERICINTLGNFRSRLYEYCEEHGRDLLGEEVSKLTDGLIELSGMDTKLARQDSMMISANCKRMGRLELIYTVNANMVRVLKDEALKIIPESCAHYLQDKDKADQLYRLKKEDVPEKTAQLLKESVELFSQVPEHLKDCQAFKNLARLIEEQTDDGHSPKDDKDQPARNMQNPSEPDATYRRKGDKASVGYSLNIVEARDNEKGMSMIVQTERQPNIVSDSELSLNTLDGDLKGVETLVSDGAFYSREVVEKALEKGIEVSFSALNGRRAPEGKLGADLFVIDPETELIIACPGGFAPASASRNREKRLFNAKFSKENCASCPFKDSCIVKEQKRFNTVTITDKKLIADRYRSLLGTDRHKALADFRAGVEGVPSVLRRVYRIDDLPVRGLVRTRIWDHLKVIAYNFKSYYSYCKRTGASPLSFQHFFRSVSRRFGFCLALACY